MKPSVPVLLVFFLCLFAAIDIRASVLTVTKTADTSDGICDADCSLREAVTVAASGDTVVFSTLFDTPQTITLTLGQINITQNLTITGTGAGLIDISANMDGRIFNISANLNVTMSGMKLRDGKVGVTAGDAQGGAIRVLIGSGNLDLSYMEFTNNYAFYNQPPFPTGLGAALYCSGCTMTLANLNVHHNLGPANGIYVDAGSVYIRDSVLMSNNGGIYGETLNMTNTTVTGHTFSGLGGRHITIINSKIVNNNGRGIYGGDTMTIENSTIAGNKEGGLTSFGTATIRNSMISNNKTLAGGGGGGIGNGGTMYIIGCSITGNQAAQGGGIWTSGGRLFVTNSTISGNTALGFSPVGLGGGIYNATTASSGSQVTLINSTIVNNQSRGMGGGIRQDATGTMTVRNTIIAQNISLSTNEADVSGSFISDGVNLVGNTTGSTGWISVDLLNQNANIAPFGNNGSNTWTHALLPGSPAINAGNNALTVDPQTMLPLMTDQRGFVRFVGGRNPTVDIGAYEASYSSSPVTVRGRITTFSGRGVDRTRIMLDDGTGNIRYGQTNPFGYYRFNNLIPGTTYTITISHKSSFFTFISPQFFTADQNRSDLNFITGL
ncbi:MAG: CSLREA domain-containing protein [Chloracidobacterium sp.]|nr:CSLREA domain-containing protein [Chloracidobacterium sp.]